jgi:hypothetical protein
MSQDYYQYYNAPPGGYQTYPNQQYYYQGYPGYTGYPPASQSLLSGWFDFKNQHYLLGALVGAGITVLAVNPNVQKAVVKGLAKAWSGLQYGVEEVKEQINDIKAEMRFKQEQKAAEQEEPADG